MINKITLLGRVGNKKDTSLPGGGNICTISVATTEKWKDKQGQKQEETTWHNVVFFGKQAELVTQYVDKGDLVYIEGRVKISTYEKNGVQMKGYSVNGTEIRFLTPKREKSDSGYQDDGKKDPFAANEKPPFDDDLPF